MAIYCIGRNYVQHALELGNQVPTTPVVFLKADIAIRDLQDGPLAFENEIFHHEAELVLTIGKDLSLGQKVGHQDIRSISLGIDLTRREVQNQLKKEGLPWTISKSFAGSALVGKPYEFYKYANDSNIVFQFKLNGQLRQRGETQNMIFSFLEICDYINSFSPLKMGDLIFTGTPEGVGEIRRGDKFELQLGSEPVEYGQL